MAVPGQLGSQWEHKSCIAEQKSDLPAPSGVVATTPCPGKTSGKQQQPWPAAFEQLGPGGPPAVPISNAAGDPSQSLAAPHQQGVIATNRPVPDMPAETRQQSEEQRHPSSSPRPTGPTADEQSDQPEAQQRGRFQQQDAAACQPGDQGTLRMGGGAEPTPPQKQCAAHKCSIEHGQPSVPGHGQQRHQHDSGQSCFLLVGVPPQGASQQHNQRHRQTGQNGRNQPHHGFLFTNLTNQQTDRRMQPRWFVEVIMIPFPWQQRRRRAGHRCDPSFIPVS